MKFTANTAMNTTMMCMGMTMRMMCAVEIAELSVAES